MRRCVKVLAGQEYAAKIINTKKLSARGRWGIHGFLPSGLSFPSPLPLHAGLEPGPESVPVASAASRHDSSSSCGHYEQTLPFSFLEKSRLEVTASLRASSLP